MAIYPFQIPSGTNLIPDVSGNNNFGSAAFGLGSIYADNIYDGNVQVAAAATAPISLTAGNISIASGSVNTAGYISSGDYLNFSNKPSLFKTFYRIVPLAATTVTTLGGPVPTLSGTASQPAWNDRSGWGQQVVAANTGISTTASLFGPTKMFARTSGSTIPPYITANDGFNASFRIYMPQVAYTTPTGIRMFVGLTDQAIGVPTAADDPNGNRVGFQYCTASGSTRQDTNWYFTVKNGTTAYTGITLPMNPLCAYDMSFKTSGTGGAIAWYLKNITSGTIAQGIQETFLPLTGTTMSPTIQLQNFPQSLAARTAMAWVYSGYYVESET